MPKYRDYFNLMLSEHEAEFKAFKPIHDAYVLNPQKHQQEFNVKGAPILRLIEEYENRLCHHSEKGEFAKFSHKTADAFRAEVRKYLSKWEDIGLEIEYAPVKQSASPPKANRLDRMFATLKKTSF